jgi:putative colanic acid biosynthesis acetyltransferase WcaF
MSAEDRHFSPYSTKEKINRLLWAAVQATVFRFSFHTCNWWRILLLNMFGAAVHNTCIIRRTVRVECPWNLAVGRNSCLGDRVIVYCLGTITIGERVSVSQNAHLCAGSHDYTKPELPLTRLPITINRDAWIAADAFIGPNVIVGEGAILGARGVAMKSLEAWTIYAGNPAKPVKSREMPSSNKTTGS